ncbi:unnamed protein product, partial [Didymodactylos carnosus]
LVGSCGNRSTPEKSPIRIATTTLPKPNINPISVNHLGNTIPT